MSGEHPLERKLREQDLQTRRNVAFEQNQQRIAEQRRAHATGEWPKDEANLNQAIEQSNAVLEKRGTKQRYTYHSLPQPHGNLFRSHLQLHDGHTACTRFLDIRVPPDGRVITVLRQSGYQQAYAVGHGNVATWNELLKQLHDSLAS